MHSIDTVKMSSLRPCQQKTQRQTLICFQCSCRISGSGRPLRFEHWVVHGDLSPTDLRPISLRDLSWKQRTTQGTQGLYWFGPLLWRNTLLQCGGGGLPLGLMMNNTRAERPPDVEAFLCSMSLCVRWSLFLAQVFSLFLCPLLFPIPLHCGG